MDYDSRIDRRRAITGALIATAMATYAVTGLEKIIVEKLLTLLIMPVGFCWLLLTMLTAAAWVCRLRWHTFGLVVTWLVFTVTGNPLVGSALVGTLESQFVGQRPLEMAPFDSLIVLGGGTNTNMNLNAQLNTSGDRIAVAAQMYHAGKVKQIIVTGKQIKELTGDRIPDPSGEAAELLVSFGVPSAAITQLGGRNTFEEMRALSTSLPKGQRNGLITSAWHLLGHCVWQNQQDSS